MEDDTQQIEILFITNSTKDNRGRRVLVRDGIIENWLWPGDLITDPAVSLLGITKSQQKQIEGFFAVGISSG